MFENLKKLLQKDPGSPAAPGNDENRFAVAACVLLLEVAHSDDDFSDVERKTIADVLRARFDMDEQELTDLIAKSEKAREDASDLFQFSQIINKEFVEEEKIKIMEILWQVVYADGVVDQHEEFLMRKLSTLLDLSHSKMIDAKLKARDG